MSARFLPKEVVLTNFELFSDLIIAVPSDSYESPPIFSEIIL